MIELWFFSLDQWQFKIHLLWGKCFNITHCSEGSWPMRDSNTLKSFLIPRQELTKPCLMTYCPWQLLVSLPGVGASPRDTWVSKNTFIFSLDVLWSTCFVMFDRKICNVMKEKVIWKFATKPHWQNSLSEFQEKLWAW